MAKIIFITGSTSSLFTRVIRFLLSSLSMASGQSNVAKVASNPIIRPSFQIAEEVVEKKNISLQFKT